MVEAFAFGCLAAAPIYLRRQRQQRIRVLRDARLQRIQAESQEAVARLQSLQAQIEPHFLFNTLAHIVWLHQVDVQRGRQMLRSLTGYMRAALPQIRGRPTSRSDASSRSRVPTSRSSRSAWASGCASRSTFLLR